MCFIPVSPLSVGATFSEPLFVSYLSNYVVILDAIAMSVLLYVVCNNYFWVTLSGQLHCWLFSRADFLLSSLVRGLVNIVAIPVNNCSLCF